MFSFYISISPIRKFKHTGRSLSPIGIHETLNLRRKEREEGKEGGSKFKQSQHFVSMLSTYYVPMPWLQKLRQQQPH
jgi:hypothetical protein